MCVARRAGLRHLPLLARAPVPVLVEVQVAQGAAAAVVVAARLVAGEVVGEPQVVARP